jgi:hypothetical protein
MDIGHIRNLTWSKDNSQREWVSHNRIRGQYMSTLEHAVPEANFNNPNLCNVTNATNSNPSPMLPECPRGISAVKAIALAGTHGSMPFRVERDILISAWPGRTDEPANA